MCRGQVEALKNSHNAGPGGWGLSRDREEWVRGREGLAECGPGGPCAGASLAPTGCVRPSKSLHFPGSVFTARFRELDLKVSFQ